MCCSFFFCKQKTADEMRISDWSSDVCSSDLGVLSATQVAAAKNGSIVRTAGVVLIRQRPGKGNAIFITLEDEGGIVNILLWARLFERQRRAVMASRLMLAEGEVQRSKEGVIHLIDRKSTRLNSSH